MSQTYTVLNVVGDPREWEGRYGKNLSYTVALKDVDGVVELSQKPETPAPKAGDELTGEITPSSGNFPPKFKKDKPQGGGNWSGGGMSPEREKKIVRQHSQHMALQYAAIHATQGKLPDEFSLGDLFKIADQFDKDAGV